ncbi:hypothetical protein MG293_020450 [Ovis ammon polii]|uniref:Uncharacterized protein n=1 Tax=Ovis ammon polii TaxID=230172 RepID=A0AAD4TJF6_OVIAM|nr:hypothetical protein MG293_020450 [Ovis ammon polii]
MLSSRGPGSKSKRRLSPPGGPWLLERFVGKPSAVPSLSWVTFGPKRANAATVLGSGQYVQRPFPQLLFLCMPIHFSSLCESPFVHLEEAMLCCNSERFTLRLFSGQFYWPILSSGTLGTSSSSLQLHQPPSSHPHTRAVQAYTQLCPLPDVDSSLVFVGIKVLGEMMSAAQPLTWAPEQADLTN